MPRALVGILGCTASLAALVLIACSSDDPESPTRVTQSVDGGTADATPKREAGVPTKCAIYSGSTSSDACSCGETAAPFGGAATEQCPIDDLPHHCLSYDVVGPPLRRECTCQPKCLFQKVSRGSSSGDGGGGDFDTCRCGHASFLLLGGDGSRDDTRASCDGYATCCKFNTGCDCTNEVGYTCPANATEVPSCTPADFNDKAWRATVYGGPAFSDIVDVPRCK